MQAAPKVTCLDRIRTERRGAERVAINWWADCQMLLPLLPLTCSCQRAWQWELPHRMAFMNESQKHAHKVVGEVANSKLRCQCPNPNSNCFFVLVFFIYSYFVCGFGDLQSVKLICQHDNNSQKP